MQAVNHFDLDTVVNRKNTGNLKEILTPDNVKSAGLLAFNAAEMDFLTAPSVIDAMVSCAKSGLYGFTLCDNAYLNAVRDWMLHVRRQKIEPDWIVPTLGTIFSVATCIRMCVGEGQNIIVQPPAYNRYKQAADRIGRGTVFNPLVRNSDGSYTIDMADLVRKMSNPANRLLVICNPHNPTGSVWPREVLEETAALAVKYDVVVYSDEIFADYSFTGEPVPMFCSLLSGKNNGISATGLGKTFNFTGANHANMLIADSDLRERFIHQKYSDHYGSLEPMHRAALLGAYCEAGMAWKDSVQELIWENYTKVREFFAETLPQVTVSPLQGGYVIWLDWSNLTDSKAEKLMTDAKLILETGSDFGVERGMFTRMNIATPRHVLEGALERLKQAVSKLTFHI